MKTAQKVPSQTQKAAAFVEFLTNVNHSHGLKSMDLKAKLNESFKDSFAWCAESIYKAEIMMQMTHELMMSDDIHEYLNELRVFVSKSFNVRRESTCELTNIASTWKFEIILYLLELVSAYDLTDVKNLNDIA